MSNNISGVYIKNEEQNNNLSNNIINDTFKGELLVSIKDIFYENKLTNIIDKRLSLMAYKEME